MNKIILLITVGLTLPVVAAEGDTPASWSCGEEDRDIHMLSNEQPYYPHSAMMFCLTGTVDAEFTIGRDGMPRAIRITESEPHSIFDQAVVDAIERWRFIPACRNGALAEREAIQAFTFELPAEALGPCSERHAQLDSEGMALLSEIGARYAMLAQYVQQPNGWQDFSAAINAPFDSFEGDLGKIAAFHQQSLAAWAPSQMTTELVELSEQTAQVLQPHAIAADPSLKQANQHLDAVRTALDQWLVQTQPIYIELAEAYQRLRQQSGLDQSTLDLLVTAFIGDFAMNFDEAFAPEIEALEHAQAIVDFLDTRRSDWQAVGRTIQFDRAEDAEAWQSIWNELIEHESDAQSRQLAFLRSFQDYTQ